LVAEFDCFCRCFTQPRPFAKLPRPCTQLTCFSSLQANDPPKTAPPKLLNVTFNHPEPIFQKAEKDTLLVMAGLVCLGAYIGRPPSISSIRHISFQLSFPSLPLRPRILDESCSFEDLSSLFVLTLCISNSLQLLDSSLIPYLLAFSLLLSFLSVGGLGP
jgi:hypothetical protein